MTHRVLRSASENAIATATATHNQQFSGKTGPSSQIVHDILLTVTQFGLPIYSFVFSPQILGNDSKCPNIEGIGVCVCVCCRDIFHHSSSSLSSVFRPFASSSPSAQGRNRCLSLFPSPPFRSPGTPINFYSTRARFRKRELLLLGKRCVVFFADEEQKNRGSR